MLSMLGVEVPSDAEGCLQDVHHAAGAFGYFPRYFTLVAQHDPVERMLSTQYVVLPLPNFWGGSAVCP